MKSLPLLPNLIIIGGSSRNVGKTTLALKLIEKYCANEKIIGLKVTSIKPGEETFHGSHESFNLQQYSIIEETVIDGRKDTSRMLLAGAEKVFYIETPDHLLGEAMSEFLLKVGADSPIICESRSLRKVVKPGLFVLLKHYDQMLIKPEFKQFEKLADSTHTIVKNSRSTGSLSDKIVWDGKSWCLNNY